MNRALKNGEALELGDRIHVKTNLNSYFLTVTRLTKTMAFAVSDGNESYEYKFNRVINSVFKPLPRERWNTASYTPHRMSNQ